MTLKIDFENQILLIFDCSWSSHRQYDQHFLAKLSVTVLHISGHANKYTGKYEF